MSESVTNSKGRWIIAIMGTFLQLCLGTVYAWSYFQKPIMTAFGWSNTQVAWVFSLAICFLGIAASFGGIRMAVSGPRKLATIGGVLFGLGYLIASYALRIHSLPLLYIGALRVLEWVKNGLRSGFEALVAV